MLAAAFFYGVLLWLAVQSDPYPAPLFAHFFWQGRKSGPAERRLQCHYKRGSPVNPDKRADRVVHPYKLLCSITAGGTAAVLPQIRHLRRQPEKNRFAVLF